MYLSYIMISFFLASRTRLFFVPGQLQEAFIYLLARKMTTNYRGLGLLLGVKSYEIDTIERNHQQDVEMVTFEIVKKWDAQCEESKITKYDKLKGALVEIGRTDLARIVTVGK